MRDDVTVLDGGMGWELKRMGAPFRQPEWSALALMEDPDAVREAHRRFIDAGADVITTNAFAVVPFHLGEERHAAMGYELAERAGRLAREAADDADRPVRVAGSIPPVFGSYQPENFDALRAPALYQLLVDAQLPHVDLWLGETIGSITEAEAILDAVDSVGAGKEVWLAFSPAEEQRDGSVRLRSGARLVEAVPAVGGRVGAILVNCSTPEIMAPALTELSAAAEAAGVDVRLGAYANTFEKPQEGEKANADISDMREMTPEAYAAFSHDWVHLGATIVGGCCGIAPSHIAAIVRDFEVIPPQP